MCTTPTISPQAQTKNKLASTETSRCYNKSYGMFRENICTRQKMTSLLVVQLRTAQGVSYYTGLVNVILITRSKTGFLNERSVKQTSVV